MRETKDALVPVLPRGIGPLFVLRKKEYSQLRCCRVPALTARLERSKANGLCSLQRGPRECRMAAGD